MPRSLHRSLTFWLGIFGVVSICWAWMDSMQHRSIMIAAGGPPLRFIESSAAAIRYQAMDNTGLGWEFSRGEEGSARWCPAPVFREASGDAFGPAYEDTYTTIIPYWVILALSLLCWLLLFLLRARRLHAAAKDGLVVR